MARRQRAEKSRRRELSIYAWMELLTGDECAGPGHSSGSSWDTDAERREAWFENRDKIMADAAARGSRLPWGHWQYEVGREDPDEVAEEARIRREIDRIDGVDS